MVVRSMTAYSQIVLECDLGSYLLELHSINRKGLETALFIPKELLQYDVEIRGWIAKIFKRGQITFRMQQRDLKGAKKNLSGQLALLTDLKVQWSEFAKALGYDLNQAVTLSFLAEQLEKVSFTNNPIETDDFHKKLQTAFSQLAEKLISMKIQEGSILLFDVKERINKLKEILQEVEKLALEQPEKFKRKLLDRLVDFPLDSIEAQERLYREIVLLVDKADVTEEIVRLRSHFAQFLNLLETSEQSIGKTLDFLMVEMNREINTLGAKSQDIELVRLVLQMKTEAERIREQIQNIE